MKQRSANSMQKIAVLGGFVLLTSCSMAQVPAASAPHTLHAVNPRTVPLISDACPPVRPGDKVSLDWNPGFEHPGAVQGLGNFSLRFGRVGSNGVTVQLVRPLLLHELASAQHFTSIGNGFFHIELTVPVRAVPGEYHIIGASALALTIPDYQGPELLMTNSPADARFCITVLPPGSTAH